MKKNQNKSKVEERKSVANQCDYSRSNGKCGRAMCENFGKLCPGRSCEDWSCDAEGEVEEVKVEGEGEQRNLPSIVHLSPSPSPNSYRDRVSDQYAAIETAKDNLLRECVKFGALLTEVGYYLGETQGKKGEGLQAWLAENCPEVNYSTAMGYKALAGKCVKMLGGGSQAVAVLQDKTEVIPPGEDAPIEVESKFIEKRDELFNEVKSRRELEQTYFKFMASEGRRGPGRPKGSKADLSRKPDSTDVVTAARAVWSQVIVQADRCAVALKGAAKLLTLEDVENAKAVLSALMEMLDEREEELKD